ncbi:MAG: glycosyltransferase [Anaerolineales bacterium]|jgi:glycosyltransferase involved in cell wall biosynthesis
MSLKVFHLITDLNTGGAEISLYRLLSGMDRAQYESQVITLLPIGPIGEKLITSGIQVRSLNMQPGQLSPGAFLHLTSWLRREHPDILQTWLYHADLLGILAAKVTRTRKVVWNLRSSYHDLSQYRQLTGIVLRLCTWLSGWPQVVVTNSRSGQEYHTHLGYHPRRWVWIPNGIDVQTFRPDPDLPSAIRRELDLAPESFLIGLVARFDPMKDHVTFLRAAGLLSPAYVNVHYVLAGEGVDASNRSLVDQIRNENLSGRVHLLGRRMDTPRLMAGLDIMSSSSSGEGFPNTIAEGMACGLPCVVTDVGDAAFLVGDTGIVVPPKNPAALADGWRRVIHLSPEDRQRLGNAARLRIEQEFSLAKTVQAYQRLYQSLA